MGEKERGGTTEKVKDGEILCVVAKGQGDYLYMLQLLVIEVTLMAPCARSPHTPAFQ